MQRLGELFLLVKDRITHLQHKRKVIDGIRPMSDFYIGQLHGYLPIIDIQSSMQWDD